MANGIGVVLAIFGIALAFWFHNRETRIKVPLWDTRIAVLIESGGGGLTDLEIRYKGEVTETVSTSTLLFWNAGKETIDESDIVDADPPRIAAADGTLLLDVRILIANEDSNNLRVVPSSDKKSAAITFDYLDHGQGGVFQVVHTGTDWQDVIIKGKVKDAGPIELRDTENFKYLPLPTPKSFDEKVSKKLKVGTRRKLVMILSLVSALITGGVLIYLLQDLGDFWSIETWTDPLSSVGKIAIVLIYLWLSYIMIRAFGRAWRTRIPPGLESFWDHGRTS